MTHTDKTETELFIAGREFLEETHYHWFDKHNHFAGWVEEKWNIPKDTEIETWSDQSGQLKASWYKGVNNHEVTVNVVVQVTENVGTDGPISSPSESGRRVNYEDDE